MDCGFRRDEDVRDNKRDQLAARRQMVKPRNLSNEPGNPTSYIHDNYQRLMAIPTYKELDAKMRTIFKLHAGKGFSQQNMSKALRTMDDLKERGDIDRLRMFVTNFMMRGSGLGVL